jgi:hypothetical protein
MFDANEEVLKQIKESKASGDYMLANFTPQNDHGVFNKSVGFNVNGGTISRNNIDADSFLKNLHIKNSKKIVYNPLNQAINFRSSSFTSHPTVISRDRKACDPISSINVHDRNFLPSVQDFQSRINYNKGTDSRHEKR